MYGELLPGERTRLHAAFARAIADEAPPDRDASRAAELAYHWQAAHDLPRAFDAWIEAGIAAEAIYASAEAEEDFEHALELWDRVPDAAARAPLDRVELLTRAAFHAEGPAPSRSVAYIRRPSRWSTPTPTRREPGCSTNGSVSTAGSPRRRDRPRRVPGGRPAGARRTTVGRPLVGPVRSRPLLRRDRSSGRSRGRLRRGTLGRARRGREGGRDPGARATREVAGAAG